MNEIDHQPFPAAERWTSGHSDWTHLPLPCSNSEKLPSTTFLPLETAGLCAQTTGETRGNCGQRKAITIAATNRFELMTEKGR